MSIRRLTNRQGRDRQVGRGIITYIKKKAAVRKRHKDIRSRHEMKKFGANLPRQKALEADRILNECVVSGGNRINIYI